LNGFSPVWVVLCLFNFQSDGKDFPQVGQTNARAILTGKKRKEDNIEKTSTSIKKRDGHFVDC
jgi:hypothetical protein